jgi:hypothetical protein
MNIYLRLLAWMMAASLLMGISNAQTDPGALKDRLETAIRNHGGDSYKQLINDGYRLKAEITGAEGGKGLAKFTEWRKGDRFRRETDYRGDTEIIIFDGTTGWRKQDYLSTRLATEEIEQRKERLFQTYFAIPRLVQMAQIEKGEEGMLPDGRKATKVTFILPGGGSQLSERHKAMIYLSDEDKIIGMEYVYFDPELNKDVRVQEMYHNLRNQDGTLLPFETRRFERGESAGNQYLLELTRKEGLGDELFQRIPSDESPIVKSTLPVTMKFELSGHLYIPIQFNDSKTYWIIIDTGAFNSTIDLKVAKEAGLEKIAGTEHGIVTLYGAFPAYSAKAKTVRIGSAEMKDITFSVSPIGDNFLREMVNGEKVIGLLGRNVLAAFQMTIDFPNRQLTLEAPDAPAPAGVVVPFELYGSHIVVTGKAGDKKDARLVVDTGAPDNLLPPAFEMNATLGHTMNLGEWYKRIGEQLPKDETGFNTKDMLIHRIHFMRIGEVKFEPVFFQQKKPDFAQRGTIYESNITQGLLGVTMMRNYKITFNYYREQMIWQSISEKERESYNAGYGLVWKHDAKTKKIVIDWVMPLSDADLAGVKKGDLILSLDAADPTKMSEVQLVNRLLNTKPGRTLKLVVDRAGKRMSFDLIARTYEL